MAQISIHAGVKNFQFLYRPQFLVPRGTAPAGKSHLSLVCTLFLEWSVSSDWSILGYEDQIDSPYLGKILKEKIYSSFNISTETASRFINFWPIILLHLLSTVLLVRTLPHKPPASQLQVFDILPGETNLKHHLIWTQWRTKGKYFECPVKSHACETTEYKSYRDMRDWHFCEVLGAKVSKITLEHCF